MPFIRDYPREGQEMVFDAHDRAFAFFRGAAKHGIYDNMRTAVDGIFVGKERAYMRRRLVHRAVLRRADVDALQLVLSRHLFSTNSPILLVLLAVLMIEAGGGLSLAVGMRCPTLRGFRHRKPTPDQNALNSAGAAIEMVMAPAFKPSVQLRPDWAPAVQAADIVELMRNAGGTLRTTTRRHGAQLGRPIASVHGSAALGSRAGLITLSADSRGTLITVAPAARPN